MGAFRKASIRQVASEAYELDGRVAQGRVHQDPQTGRWKINNIDLEIWLEEQADEDVTLILIPTQSEEPSETKTCRTCGRDYRGAQCPYCREVRFRLRGR
jgi:hypothetical protein